MLSTAFVSTRRSTTGVADEAVEVPARPRLASPPSAKVPVATAPRVRTRRRSMGASLSQRMWSAPAAARGAARRGRGTRRVSSARPDRLLRIDDEDGADSPAAVRVDRVDGQRDRPDVAAVELGLQARDVSELGRADGREVARVGEEDTPAVAEPL